ncbi:MAG: hypothetical protein QNK05_24245 [Myxococcota bacterium]|nr:hypothetical protein [Myxococcota bacterium]
MALEARPRRPETEIVQTTLLELVQVVSEVARNEREVVATVKDLLRSGRVRLTGNFRDDPPVH